MHRKLIHFAAATAFAALLAGPSLAYEIGGETYHADSFGNLVVTSPAGYKRIIVGQGHLVAELAAQAEPSVIGSDGRRFRPHPRCHYEPGMFKGRSYMYGLADDVVPTPARRICD